MAQAVVGGGEWDAELLEHWRQSGLSAHHLHMAELRMNLFGRQSAYQWLEGECREHEILGDTKQSRPSAVQGNLFSACGVCMP